MFDLVTAKRRPHPSFWMARRSCSVSPEGYNRNRNFSVVMCLRIALWMFRTDYNIGGPCLPFADLRDRLGLGQETVLSKHLFGQCQAVATGIDRLREHLLGTTLLDEPHQLVDLLGRIGDAGQQGQSIP